MFKNTIMKHIHGLKCVKCGREYAADDALYVCRDCGLKGTLDVVYDMNLVSIRLLRRLKTSSAVREPLSIRRYMDLLPIQDERHLPPLQIGWTPLYDCREFPEWARRTRGTPYPRRLFIKDDGRNPTASLKDRASAMAVAKAKELGKQVITCASTGNAASSLAGLAASVGVSTVIFVPETAPKAKIAQLMMHGAQVFMVKGAYDQAYDLCLQASAEWGWYNRNSGYNPYLSEGKKTAALEICEQLGWKTPDKVFVAVGDGCILGGLWKGFCDLYELGLIDKRPQMIGVQAAGASPLVTAFETGQPVQPLRQIQTVADSIAVGQPRDALKALRAARDSGGRLMAVSDEDILDAMRALARHLGIFAEPAGAAAFAGLHCLTQRGEAQPDDTVVVVVTGNGLKDIETAIRAAGSPTIIEPDIEAVRNKLRH